MKTLWGAMCCAVALAGCGMAPTTAPDGSVGFPNRDSASMKDGTFVDVDNVRLVEPGLTKNQVYALLQAPHFNEGVFGVHVWNYILNFRTQPDGKVLSCQYQVQYDDGGKVKATYWKEPDCASYVNGTHAAAVAPAPVAHKRITLDASVLFAFDKSALEDLRAEGRARLDEIAKSLVADDAGMGAIEITGYTDRLGSQAYNQNLSTARAQTIRTYLIDRGVPAGKVHAAGRGSASPVSAGCGAGRSPEVIRCLAPDRRVTIETTPG
ncbi:OmpA family protein [Burkholderia guangdongensis]|uniref:OmpA family protein n=1 Tax=Burkholderia guangdongensis TaxID=1792500 RepID=UPI001C54B3FB|nr:OmpA family protein [Burkholderia guangdongensis]